MNPCLGDVDESSVRGVEWITRDMSEAAGEVTCKLWSQEVVGREPRGIFIEDPITLNNVGNIEVAHSAAVLSRLCLRDPSVDGIQTLISQSPSAASHFTGILLGVCIVAVCLLVRQKTLEDCNTEVVLVQLAAACCNCLSKIAAVRETKVVDLRSQSEISDLASKLRVINLSSV